jgi:hypothetical protein
VPTLPAAHGVPLALVARLKKVGWSGYNPRYAWFSSPKLRFTKFKVFLHSYLFCYADVFGVPCLFRLFFSLRRVSAAYKDPTDCYKDPTERYKDPTEHYKDPTKHYKEPIKRYKKLIKPYTASIKRYTKLIKPYTASIKRYKQPKEQKTFF